ncbi:MAG TPA: HD domain-containing phosphohydrolase [Pyrinomonadaceae bacterium]|nr:HD domain-containing phosphohydrolase [Pyrinomonadaceae bacterium]
MSEKKNAKAVAYQTAVTAAGCSLWAAAAASVVLRGAPSQQLALAALVPLVLAASAFPLTFPAPARAKVTGQKISFTLTDALVLLVACRYGALPAVLLAGLDGMVGSRRAVRRLSSNLFSSSMMSLAVGAGGLVLGAVLRLGFGEERGAEHGLLAVAVATLLASLALLATNVGLLSALFALHAGESVVAAWRRNLAWAVPMFIPTATAATLMYVALRQGALVVFVIGAPVLFAIYFFHRTYRDGVEDRIRLVEEANRERLGAVESAHRQTIEALAVAINAKDEVTHEHVLRVQIYAAGVARLLGCTEAEVEALKAGALLHDIGKIAVPDYILNKPGKLTAAEFARMKLHTVAGAQILGRVEFPYPVVPVVRSHHERWDGRGYPDGLRGEEIPLTARILSVVDCFDAVREDRQYRRGMTRDEAINFLMEGSGTQYDPRVVGTFVTHLPEFEAEIAARRDAPVPNYGIEPLEQLSEAALGVAPAAGLAEEAASGAADSRDAQAGLTREERAALEELSRALEGCDMDEELTDVVVKRLGALVPFDTCAFARVVPGTGESQVVRAEGRAALVLLGRTVTPGEGVTGWALANRRAFANTDPRLDLPAALAAHFEGFRTLAVAPVECDGELFGALSLYSAALAAYTDAHQRLLAEAARLFAAALARPARGVVVEPSVTPSIESTLTH